jgi:hypothetical protein
LSRTSGNRQAPELKLAHIRNERHRFQPFADVALGQQWTIVFMTEFRLAALNRAMGRLKPGV